MTALTLPPDCLTYAPVANWYDQLFLLDDNSFVVANEYTGPTNTTPDGDIVGNANLSVQQLADMAKYLKDNSMTSAAVLALLASKIVESVSIGAGNTLPLEINLGESFLSLKIKLVAVTVNILTVSTWAYTDVTFPNAFDLVCLGVFCYPQSAAAGTTAPPSTGVDQHEVSDRSINGFRLWASDDNETLDADFIGVAIGI